jgi:hypothetical protein
LVKKGPINQLGTFEKLGILVMVVVPTKMRSKFMMKHNGKEYVEEAVHLPK